MSSRRAAPALLTRRAAAAAARPSPRGACAVVVEALELPGGLLEGGTLVIVIGWAARWAVDSAAGSVVDWWPVRRAPGLGGGDGRRSGAAGPQSVRSESDV
jgi:hypothetical protein